MSTNTNNDTETPPDYEALNNAFYSIVDSLFPKDFGQLGVKQTDADVLVKIRRAKEKERHRYVFLSCVDTSFLMKLAVLRRASIVENGNASTSSIPHANLLKRKLQGNGKPTAGSADADPTGEEAVDDDESEGESRTRSLGKKTKVGYDAFSKPGKGKSKGKRKETASVSTPNITSHGQGSDSAPSKSLTKSDNVPSPYLNPFAMPSATTSASPATESTADTAPVVPGESTAPDETGNVPPESTAAAAEVSKNQRKKQRKKEKKALAKAESEHLQSEANGKLAVGLQ
ncbi:hypothetical protein QFC21_000864 [Naganishia friedmannii]|uniref:Uncharacterized protein n=1 Tax=Naganishia friedmannii TaxID=89922 RepID=A0ACC2W7I4_9TREE|nr:hypothetical protein QFC21_000864 [Naganishia friedmannii]